MRNTILAVAVFGLATGLWGQAPKGAPAGATGMCKDGTYAMGAERGTACQGHSGVQSWYAPSQVSAAPAPSPATSAPAAMPAPTPAASVASAPATAATGKKLSPAQAAAAKTAAPGGGKGLVWVNTASNVYHCSDDPFYGKTKAGAYMSEADAKAKGAHGERGKTCEGK
jgi:hypothetical protein